MHGLGDIFLFVDLLVCQLAGLPVWIDFIYVNYVGLAHEDQVILFKDCRGPSVGLQWKFVIFEYPCCFCCFCSFCCYCF